MYQRQQHKKHIFKDNSIRNEGKSLKVFNFFNEITTEIEKISFLENSVVSYLLKTVKFKIFKESN